eukprot:TRINITY_DN4755_c0_g1_i1.p2 TRINITY_DN4755_c0_g1~~TRINITY_DN4755_c0_g1_i1.p2  ORF type:complete len:109 (-),score=21.92 TRINITY_DN4755_c0_g1_i1:16-342(-)
MWILFTKQYAASARLLKPDTLIVKPMTMFSRKRAIMIDDVLPMSSVSKEQKHIVLYNKKGPSFFFEHSGKFPNDPELKNFILKGVTPKQQPQIPIHLQRMLMNQSKKK